MKKLLFLICITSLFLAACTQTTELYRVQENGLYGFVNGSGEVVITPQYKYVGMFTKDGYACVINDISFEKDSFPNLTDSIVTISYGYINKNNKIVVDTTNIIRFHMSKARIWMIGNAVDLAYQYINNDLVFNTLALCELDLNDGLYLFQDAESKLFGYKDCKGNIKIEAKYEWGHNFSSGVAVVCKKKSFNYDIDHDLAEWLKCYGVIDKYGNEICSGYATINDYGKDGLTWAQSTSYSTETSESKRDWVQIDTKGNIKIGPVSGPAWVYNNDDIPLCVINFGFRYYYTFLDENGEFLTDFNHDKILEINFTGEKRSEAFRGATRFGNGAAGIKGYNEEGDSAWYFVDREFNIISDIYDSVKCFDNGYAAVKEKVNGELPNVGKWGYVKIDETDNSIRQVIPFSFSDCGRFTRELTYFKKKGSTFDIEGLINKQGDMVWQTKKPRDPIAKLSNKIDSSEIDSSQNIDVIAKKDWNDNIAGIILLLLLAIGGGIGIWIIVAKIKKKELLEIDTHLANAASAIASRDALKARNELTQIGKRIKKSDVERRKKFNALSLQLDTLEANIEVDKCITTIESAMESEDAIQARCALDKAKSFKNYDVFHRQKLNELTEEVETLELNAKIDSYFSLAKSAIGSRKLMTVRTNLKIAEGLIKKSDSFRIKKLKDLSSRLEKLEIKIKEEADQKIKQLKNDFETGNFVSIQTIEGQAQKIISLESPTDIRQTVNTFVEDIEEQYKNGLAQTETTIQHIIYDANQIAVPNKEGFYCYALLPSINTVLYPYRRKKVERRGYSEESFQDKLSTAIATLSNLQVLGDISILPHSGMHPYEPDIAIIEKTFKKGLRIDVEIDEPYSGYDRKPIHFIGCGDGYRDQVLINHGWIVVRFSEKQIVNESRKCIAFIKYIISTILETDDAFLDYPTYDKRWTENEARIMSVEQYREKMLHHEFGITPPSSQSTIDSTQTEAERKASLEVRPIVYERKSYINLNNSTDSYPQDKLISFNSAEHIYLYNGQEITSVSTLVAKFFPEFNPIDHAGRVAEKEGCSIIEIMERWDAAGAESREIGTFMHAQIEQVLNSGTPQIKTHFHYEGQYEKIDKDVSIEKELQYFKSFRLDNRIQPYRTEWRIFDETYNIAGTIDLLCKQGNTFEIYDWKRSRKADPDETIWRYGINGLEHIPDIAFYHYALQQNLYKYILEKNYGIHVSKMYIVVFHPMYDSYLKYEIPLMDKEVEFVLTQHN